MKKLEEVRVGEHWISLTKLTGKKILDIEGSVSDEFGEPVFKLFKLTLEDGSNCFIKGEHDIAYLEDGWEIVSQEQLQSLSDEEEEEFKKKYGN